MQQCGEEGLGVGVIGVSPCVDIAQRYWYVFPLPQLELAIAEKRRRESLFNGFQVVFFGFLWVRVLERFGQRIGAECVPSASGFF